MQNLKNYGLIMTIVLVVVILVMIQTLGNGHFRRDAGKWTGPSADGANLITAQSLGNLDGEVMLVDLSEQGVFLKEFEGTIGIPAKTLMEKANQKILRNHKGSIVLVSEDRALAARIWMLLSQMGYSRLYILADSANQDALKYKFRPDTLTRPES